MKNIGSEQSPVLTSESYSYPWQVLEADNETWMVMRWKERVSSKPLSKVCGVALDNFSWNVAYQDGEKCFYDGEIALEIYYQEEDFPINITEIEEAGKNEDLFRKLLFTGQGMAIDSSKKRKDRVCETSFSELLLEGEELKEEVSSAENKTWKFCTSWRAWLKGRGENEEPVLQKVHVAQVGLYTLMAEAIIKLAISKQQVDDDREICTILPEEAMFELSDDSVCDVIGMPIARAFGECSYNAKEEKLLLRDIKKTSLLYTSSLTGGERFLTASAFEDELITIKNYLTPLYPAAIEIWQEEVAQTVVDEKNVFYTGKVFCQIEVEPVDMKAEQEEDGLDVEKADDKIQEKSSAKTEKNSTQMDYENNYENEDGQDSGKEQEDDSESEHGYDEEQEQDYQLGHEQEHQDEKESEKDKEKEQGAISLEVLQGVSTEKPALVKAVPVPQKRIKPGEKWLKKQDSKSQCTLKAVITIKV